jgi:hypothetical protein
MSHPRAGKQFHMAWVFTLETEGWFSLVAAFSAFAKWFAWLQIVRASGGIRSARLSLLQGEGPNHGSRRAFVIDAIRSILD